MNVILQYVYYRVYALMLQQDFCPQVQHEAGTLGFPPFPMVDDGDCPGG